MKKIPLSRGLVAWIDDIDFDRVRGFRYHAHVGGAQKRNFYAARWIRTESGERRRIFLHREILRAGEGQMVDHRNHDTLDNRRKNIRIATRSQNSQNKIGPFSNSKSGIRGVSFFKNTEKWVAKLSKNGRVVFQGHFKTKAVAAAAYAAANRKFLGEFGGGL